jgi:hypothetical protein
MFEYFQNSLYTHLILYCTLAIALIVTHKSRRSKIRMYFLVYLWSMVLVEIIAAWGSTTPTFDRFSMPIISHSVNIIFSIIEFITLGLFFKATLNNKLTTITYKTVVCLQISAFLVFLYMATGDFSDMFYIRFGNIFYSIELFLLASLCINYLIKFFKSSEDTNLKSIPNFWIVTGLFFYSIMSIPFCLISTEVVSIDKLLFTYLIAVHFIFLSLFFISITKAFLCKREFQIY